MEKSTQTKMLRQGENNVRQLQGEISTRTCLLIIPLNPWCTRWNYYRPSLQYTRIFYEAIGERWLPSIVKPFYTTPYVRKNCLFKLGLRPQYVLIHFIRHKTHRSPVICAKIHNRGLGTRPTSPECCHSYEHSLRPAPFHTRRHFQISSPYSKHFVWRHTLLCQTTQLIEWCLSNHGSTQLSTVL